MHSWKTDKKFRLLLLLAFAAGFLTGILLTQKTDILVTEKAGMFGDYYLGQYAQLEIDKMELLCLIVRERGKWMILMWALGFTAAGAAFVYVFSAFWGFLFAVVSCAAFCQNGMRGLGLLVLSGIPQMLIYVPLWLYFLQAVSEKSHACREMRIVGRISLKNRQYVMVLLCGILILFLGNLTESYLNSWLIQQVLHIF